MWEIDRCSLDISLHIALLVWKYENISQLFNKSRCGDYWVQELLIIVLWLSGNLYNTQRCQIWPISIVNSMRANRHQTFARRVSIPAGEFNGKLLFTSSVMRRNEEQINRSLKAGWESDVKVCIEVWIFLWVISIRFVL